MNTEKKAMITYLGSFFTGLFFILTERKNQFLKKCAVQSIILGLTYFSMSILLKITPFIGNLLSGIWNILFIITTLVLAIKAGEGEFYKLPFIGKVAEKYVQQNLKKE